MVQYHFLSVSQLPNDAQKSASSLKLTSKKMKNVYSLVKPCNKILSYRNVIFGLWFQNVTTTPILPKLCSVDLIGSIHLQETLANKIDLYIKPVGN